VAVAFDYLVKAIELDPDYAEAYSWLSSALLLIWQFEHDAPALQRAIDVAQQGVDLDPQSARCHMMLGYSLLMSGEKVRSDSPSTPATPTSSAIAGCSKPIWAGRRNASATSTKH
jgi:hypothetical protein